MLQKYKVPNNIEVITLKNDQRVDADKVDYDKDPYFKDYPSKSEIHKAVMSIKTSKDYKDGYSFQIIVDENGITPIKIYE